MKPTTSTRALLAVALGATVAGGCISSPNITRRERCALEGLSLAGTANVAAGGAVGSVTGVFAADRYQCVPPPSERDRCEAEALAAAAREKAEFGVTGRNVALAVGYVVYILPGVVMYVVFNSQRKGVVERASAVETERLAACQALPATPRESRETAAN